MEAVPKSGRVLEMALEKASFSSLFFYKKTVKN
jgi:hypothetical protein